MNTGSRVIPGRIAPDRSRARSGQFIKLGERCVFPRRYGSEQLKVHFPVPDLWAAADSGSCLQDSLDLVKAGQPGQKLLADVLPNKIQVLFPVFFQHRYQIIF